MFTTYDKKIRKEFASKGIYAPSDLVDETMYKNKKAMEDDLGG